MSFVVVCMCVCACVCVCVRACVRVRVRVYRDERLSQENNSLREDLDSAKVRNDELQVAVKKLKSELKESKKRRRSVAGA